MLRTVLSSLSYLNNVKHSCFVSKRYFSYGALPGGFSKEALQQWANQQWKNKSFNNNDENEHYVDLFSHKLTMECTNYLNNHDQHPSNQLAQCFFGSYRFLPERLLLSPFYKTYSLPSTFRINEQYLAWRVQVQSPLEIICSWQINTNIKGCTMIAYDPVLRKVYHGNCIHSSATQNGLFRSVVEPVHVKYAQFLLVGMVQEIENMAKMAGTD